MRIWAWTFLVGALLAALLGFFALEGVAATVSKVAFFLFLALLVGAAFDDALRHVPPV